MGNVKISCLTASIRIRPLAVAGVIEKAGLNRVRLGLAANVVSGAARAMPIKCRYHAVIIPTRCGKSIDSGWNCFLRCGWRFASTTYAEPEGTYDEEDNVHPEL